ncbi:MAG: hypothetical protein ACKN85_01155 [Pirellula sp.]|jgi:hypothetical protein|nr:hypothetical protein [Planctomycetota bacterium]
MKRFIWAATFAAMLGQVGCNSGSKDQLAQQKESAPVSAPSATGSNAQVANPRIAGEAASAAPQDEMVPLSSLNLANPIKPEEVVGAFLEGMRTSNAQVIETLLSTRARQEIKAKGLEISPIGSPNASFEIGKAQQIDPKDPNVMLVSSNWIEPAAVGMPSTEYEVVWALIKEVDGWRICEMAVDTHTEGEEVQVVNFENLSEVVGEQPTERTASLPSGSTQAPPPPVNAPGLPSLPALPSGSPQGLPAAPSLPSTPAGTPGLPALPASSGASLPSVPPPSIPAGLPPLGGAGK